MSGEHIVRSDFRSFVGVENVSVPAGEFSTIHIRETYKQIDSLPDDTDGVSSNLINFYDIWFAPSAGMYVKTIDTEMNNGVPSNFSDELIKYLPK